jgi:signal transduction histidine kinase
MHEAGEAIGWDGDGLSGRQPGVEALHRTHRKVDGIAELAHDARNLVTALGLYCDLLDEPGVLTAPFIHYGNELRLVAAASRRLVEKLVASELEGEANAALLWTRPGQQSRQPLWTGQELRDPAAPKARPAQRWDLMPAAPIDSLAGELMANRNLLAALAGPTIALTVETDGAALPVRLNGEDLTRVLVNLVKNAAEAMPGGGKIYLRLREQAATAGKAHSVVLTVEDSGRGIASKTLEKIFEAGFSTRSNSSSETGWPATHRGLGLSITRSIIAAAGGTIQAGNREPSGARMEIELPVSTR